MEPLKKDVFFIFVVKSYTETCQEIIIFMKITGATICDTSNPDSINVTEAH